ERIRLFDRNVGRFGTAENFINDLGSPAMQISHIWSIRHQTSCIDMLTEIVGCRQVQAQRSAWPSAQRYSIATVRPSIQRSLDHPQQRILETDTRPVVCWSLKQRRFPFAWAAREGQVRLLLRQAAPVAVFPTLPRSRRCCEHDFDGTPNAPALRHRGLLDISNQAVTITKWLH